MEQYHFRASVVLMQQMEKMELRTADCIPLSIGELSQARVAVIMIM
jgi:hypothetical protein